KLGRKLPVDVPWEDVDVELYDALIIPGGRAPEWIRTDDHVRRITEHFFARNLPIALICHGAQVPAVYGLLKGRKTACFPPITGDMENAGATVIDAPVVVDGSPVRVVEGGTGPAVLLLHGSGPGTTGSGAWATTIEALAGSWHLVAPDQAGFGGTPLPPGSRGGLRTWTERAAALMDAL